VRPGEGAWLATAPWGITDRVRARLAATAREAAAEWNVELGEMIEAGRFSYVAFAGDDAILKVVPVEDDEADHEADALALLAGDGAVRLLRQDRERRAMLIERARPGFDASGLSEYEAIRVATAAAKRFWRPAARDIPSAGSATTCRAGWTTPVITTSSGKPRRSTRR
jgi:streptomycin 6-kinase